MKPEGYAVDKNFNNIIYLPEDARIDLNSQRITWSKVGQSQEIKLLPNNTYVLPSGYKVEMMKPAEGRRWRLVGTADGGSFSTPGQADCGRGT